MNYNCTKVEFIREAIFGIRVHSCLVTNMKNMTKTSHTKFKIKLKLVSRQPMTANSHTPCPTLTIYQTYWVYHGRKIKINLSAQK